MLVVTAALDCGSPAKTTLPVSEFNCKSVPDEATVEIVVPDINNDPTVAVFTPMLLSLPPNWSDTYVLIAFSVTNAVSELPLNVQSIENSLTVDTALNPNSCTPTNVKSSTFIVAFLDDCCTENNPPTSKLPSWFVAV